MKVKLITVLFTIFFIISTTHQSQDYSKIIQLLEKTSTHQQTSFNKILINSIQLKLQSKGKLDEVYQLLNQLYQDIVNQQSKAQNTHTTQNNAWDSEQAQLNTEINDLTTQITNDQTTLAALLKTISQDDKDLTLTNTKLQVLSEKIPKIDQARQNDLDAYTKRQDEQNKKIRVLDEILDILANQLPANPTQIQIKQSLIQTTEKLIYDLKKIGKSSPINALVALTMSFDPKTLQDAIAKLKQIRESFQKSLEDDQLAEDKARQAYETLSNELSTQQAKLQADKYELEKRLAKNRSIKATLEGNIKTNTDARTQKQERLNTVVNDQKTENAQYNKDSNKRTDELQTIKAVEQLLQSQQNKINSNYKLSDQQSQTLNG